MVSIKTSDGSPVFCPPYQNATCIYTCSSDWDFEQNNEREEHTITINFSYVIYPITGKNVDLEKELPDLESRMLVELASKFDGCRLGFSDDVEYNWLYGINGGEDNISLLNESNASVLSLEAFPTDVEDTEHRNCVVEILNTTCIPIKGYMDVKFVSSDFKHEQVAKVLYNYLDRGMDEDWFISENIPKLSFIERISAEENSISHSFVTGNQTSIGAVVAIIMGLLFGGLILVKRSVVKRQHKDKLKSAQAGEDKGLQMYDSELERASYFREGAKLKMSEFNFKEQYLDNSKHEEDNRAISFENEDMQREEAYEHDTSFHARSARYQSASHTEDLEDRLGMLPAVQQVNTSLGQTLSTISEGSKESDESMRRISNAFLRI